MKVYESEKVVLKEEMMNTSVEVIRQGYFLLGLTLLFSAITCFLTLTGWLPLIMNGFLGIILLFGSLWLAQAYSHSKTGLIFTFIFTGLMGNYVAPILAYYLSNFTNGFGLVLGALFGTAGIFFSLSLYVWISKKNFTYLYGMLWVGLLAAFAISCLSLFLGLNFMQGVISTIMVIVASGFILADTSLAIHRGIHNPILLAVNLYVDIWNLFLHLLRILSIFAGKEK